MNIDREIQQLEAATQRLSRGIKSSNATKIVFDRKSAGRDIAQAELRAKKLVANITSAIRDTPIVLVEAKYDFNDLKLTFKVPETMDDSDLDPIIEIKVRGAVEEEVLYERPTAGRVVARTNIKYVIWFPEDF
jgi:hypothetical protein